MGENVFYIPSLQRPFDWGDEQVEELLSDIRVVLDATRIRPKDDSPHAPVSPRSYGHFLGTIVTQQSQGRLAILDGQQRLTCLTLLVALTVVQAKSCHERCHEEPQRLRIDNVITELSRLVLQAPDGKGHRALRLDPSPEIRRTLEDFVRGGSGEVASENLGPAEKLRSAAQLISTFVNDQTRGEIEAEVQAYESLRRCISEQLLVIHMSTDAPDAAFSIFESLNSRGEPLKMIHLLKIWVMSEMAGDEREQAVTDVLRTLSTPIFTDDDPDSFFETFYTVQNLGTKPKARGNRRQKLFAIEFRERLLKPQASEDHEDRTKVRAQICSTFEHAKRMRPIYNSLEFRDKCKSHDIDSYPVSERDAFDESRLDALLRKPLAHKLAIPLLIRASEVLANRPEELHKLIHDLERLFFRIKLIQDCHAQVFTHAYRAIFESLNDDSYTTAERRKAFNLLLEQHSPKVSFVLRLKEQLRYRPGDDNKLIKYFLWMIELYSANNPPARIVADLEDYSIEHIFPQAADPNMLREEEDLHRLGNLCLLIPEENSVLSNRSYFDKREIVRAWRDANRDLQCSHSRSVFRFEQWTSDEIDHMEERLCDQACIAFGFDG
jgi:hypothetical protein